MMITTPNSIMDRVMDASLHVPILGVIGIISVMIFWKYFKRSHRVNTYETAAAVDEYMGFHYATPSEYIGFPLAPQDSVNFPVRCAELCRKHKKENVISRALDIGCSVGRSTFELSTVFDKVIGIDYSKAFIDKANELASNGRSSYKLKVEGDVFADFEARISSNINKSKVEFKVGDACALPNDIGQFGMILAANLICRLPNPRKFLDSLKNLVEPGGIVVITSPYTWLEEYTSKENWIGGFIKDEVPVKGFDSLKELLSPYFSLLECKEMPFLLRETVRKHQWTVAHATVWMRKTDK